MPRPYNAADVIAPIFVSPAETIRPSNDTYLCTVTIIGNARKKATMELFGEIYVYWFGAGFYANSVLILPSERGPSLRLPIRCPEKRCDALGPGSADRRNATGPRAFVIGECVGTNKNYHSVY